jgi:hypothetical protein
VKPDYLGLEPPLPANTDTYALFGWRDRHARDQRCCSRYVSDFLR